MNLKYENAQLRRKVSDLETENSALRDAIEMAGFAIVEGQFVQRDGTTCPFYLRPATFNRSG